MPSAVSGRTERWCFSVFACLCRERCGVITLRPTQNGQTSRHRWDSLGPSGGNGSRRFGRKRYIDLGKRTEGFLSLWCSLCIRRLVLCSESDEVRGRCLLISKLINGLIQLHLHLNGKKRLFDSWLTHLKKQGAVLIIVRPVHCSALLLHQVKGLNNVWNQFQTMIMKKQLAWFVHFLNLTHCPIQCAESYYS